MQQLGFKRVFGSCPKRHHKRLRTENSNFWQFSSKIFPSCPSTCWAIFVFLGSAAMPIFLTFSRVRGFQKTKRESQTRGFGQERLFWLLFLLVSFSLVFLLFLLRVLWKVWGKVRWPPKRHLTSPNPYFVVCLFHCCCSKQRPSSCISEVFRLFWVAVLDLLLKNQDTRFHCFFTYPPKQLLSIFLSLSLFSLHFPSKIHRFFYNIPFNKPICLCSFRICFCFSFPPWLLFLSFTTPPSTSRFWSPTCFHLYFSFCCFVLVASCCCLKHTLLGQIEVSDKTVFFNNTCFWECQNLVLFVGCRFRALARF